MLGGIFNYNSTRDTEARAIYKNSEKGNYKKRDLYIMQILYEEMKAWGNGVISGLFRYVTTACS